MMLAANSFYHQMPSMPSYSPARSSPLAERSINVIPSGSSFTMSSQPQFSFEAKKPVSAAPQRAYKQNPVLQSRDATTQRRRNMFFRRVQKDRDDRKWEGRGEQIQRLDWISDQKRWEAEKARQAAKLVDDWIEEDADLSAAEGQQLATSSVEKDADEIEYLLAQEKEELEAYVAAMDDSEQYHLDDTASQHFGSDIDDYDQIFLECTPEADMEQVMDATNVSSNYPDDMDMTDG